MKTNILAAVTGSENRETDELIVKQLGFRPRVTPNVSHTKIITSH